jgi:hypothetical protein
MIAMTCASTAKDTCAPPNFFGVLLQQHRSNAFGDAQGFGFVGDPMGGRWVDRINGRFRHTSLSAPMFARGHGSFCA